VRAGEGEGGKGWEERNGGLTNLGAVIVR